MNDVFFFFNDTATTEIYTLSLHDALPIFLVSKMGDPERIGSEATALAMLARGESPLGQDPSWARLNSEQRSEEHTSELQSRQYLVCRLLLEKKKDKRHYLLP